MSEVHRTGRWFGLAGAALVAVGVGLVGQVPALMLLGGLGVTLSAYDRVAVPPAADVSIQRSITPTEPALGERVTVALTVRNDGSRTIPDLRLADGVPDSVRVVDGSASVVTTLLFQLNVPPLSPLALASVVLGAIALTAALRR
ncbi:DUF58 domain-containing protein [Haloarcula hispanica]|uniref:hypothetical protein n=1 Tax=Haloarcula hispanica TaxID=51589 RepID=UPI001F5DD35F|nr:hypothetical protein [Haloarcula hispanica]